MIRENATSETVTYVSERTGDFPGVSVEGYYVRNYPLGPTAAHVLGYPGVISQEEPAGSDGELTNEPIVGKSGIELVYEDLLREDPTKRTYRLESRGRVADRNQQVASDEEREGTEA